MHNILIYIKQLCSDCFRDSRKDDAEDFNQWLIQSKLHEMQKLSKKHSSDRHSIKKISSSKQLSLQNECDDKMPNMLNEAQTSLRKSKKEINLADQPQQEEDFYSIDSKNGELSHKTHGQMAKLTESNFSSGESMEEANNYQSTEECRVQSETERLAAWMRNQYEDKGRRKHFQVRSAVRLRAQGQGLAGLLLHKLEDFKVSFLSESRLASLSLTNRSKSLRASFQSTIVGSSSSRLSQVTAYYHIECCTLAVTELLRFFKRRNVLQALHGFSEVVICRAEGWTGLELPLLSAKQGKREFHLAWKMGEIQSADEEGQQIHEVGFSLDEGQGGWQRLIKYYLSKKGYIDVYVESYEEPGLFEHKFFTQKFTALQKLLVKYAVIDK